MGLLSAMTVEEELAGDGHLEFSIQIQIRKKILVADLEDPDLEI